MPSLRQTTSPEPIALRTRSHDNVVVAAQMQTRQLRPRIQRPVQVPATRSQNNGSRSLQTRTNGRVARRRRPLRRRPIIDTSRAYNRNNRRIYPVITPLHIEGWEQMRLRFLAAQRELRALGGPSNEEVIEISSSSPSSLSSSSSEFSDSNDAVRLSCGICLESYVKKQPTITPCGHLYCKKCIYRSLQDSDRCPICNSRISGISLIRIYL